MVAKKISDHLKELLHSKLGYQLTGHEIMKLMPLTRISDKFTTLIKSEEKIFKEKADTLEYIEPLIEKIISSRIIARISNYEEREGIEDRKKRLLEEKKIKVGDIIILKNQTNKWV